MTLIEWLQERTDDAAHIALREGSKVWDIWDLLYFVKRCTAIPRFPYGDMLRSTHVYLEGPWLFSEEDGRRLYELVVKTPQMTRNPLLAPLATQG